MRGADFQLVEENVPFMSDIQLEILASWVWVEMRERYEKEAIASSSDPDVEFKSYRDIRG